MRTGLMAASTRAASSGPCTNEVGLGSIQITATKVTDTAAATAHRYLPVQRWMMAVRAANPHTISAGYPKNRYRGVIGRITSRTIHDESIQERYRAIGRRRNEPLTMKITSERPRMT